MTVRANDAVESFALLIGQLAETKSAKQKQTILSQVAAAGQQDALSLLRYALDPFITFGIASFDVPTDSLDPGDDFSFDYVCIFLDALAQRHMTGARARGHLDTMLKMFPAEAPSGGVSPREAFARIVRKDLRCGLDVGGSTIQKAFPGLIRTFGCQLAAREMPSVDELSYPIVVEPKYDGVRCITVIDEHGVVSLYSRNGKQFENFAEIEEAIACLGLRGRVLDGEIIGQDHANQYKGVMARARGHRGTNDHIPVVYQLFDTITLDVFEGRRPSVAAWGDRRSALEEFIKRASLFGIERGLLELAPYSVVGKPEELQAVYEQYVARGFEGVIVKDPSKPYELKRSKSWRKLKPMDTADLTVIDSVEGEGKYASTLGALIVEGEHLGKMIRTKVGSGFDDATRNDLWHDRQSLLGRLAEIRYQEITIADGSEFYSLRFPVFVRFRGGGVDPKI